MFRQSPLFQPRSIFERCGHLFRYRHAHRHPAGFPRGRSSHGPAFGPGGPFENPLGERADNDGGDDHADGAPEARDEVRLCMVGPEPGDQRQDQRQAGGQGSELVEHQGNVFCQIFVGRFGVSFSPFERLFLGRFGFGQSCGLSVIA